MNTARRRARRARWAPELAVLGVTIYAAGAVTVLALDPRLPVALPAWTTLVVPPVVYALLALLVVRRFTVSRILGATAVASGLHGLLLVATDVAAPWIAPLFAETTPAASLVFGAELGAIVLVSVPLMLAPLRRFVVVRIRRAQRGVRAAVAMPYGLSPRMAGPATEAPRSTVAPPPAASAPAATPASVADAGPAPAAMSGGPGTPPPIAAAPSQASAVPAPEAAAPAPAAASQMPPSAAPSPSPTERREPARTGSSTPPPAQSPAPEAIEELVRVSFARVAEQLPADLFKLTAERLAVNLLEAGYLLVPRRLVIPQLAEGHVEVAWEVVADQFPSQARVASDADIAARLDHGALSLPLDEIVRQLPSELFLLSSPIIDVSGIENFPPPFQPHVPPSSALNVASEQAEAEMAVEQPRPVEETPPIAPEPPMPTLGDPPEASVLADLARVELPDLDDRGRVDAPVVDEPALPEPLAIVESPPPAALAEPDPVAEPDAVAEADSVAEPAASTEPGAVAGRHTHDDQASLPPAVATRRAAGIDVRRLAALLAPLPSALAIDARAGGDEMLLTVVPPTLDDGAVVDTARRVLPFLADDALPAAAQATIRAAGASIVVTPLAPGEAGIPTLVAAAATGASLALLERLSLRAAADWRAAREDWPADPRPARRHAADGALRESAVPTHVRAMAAAFGALGAVAPTVIRDDGGTLLVYLFLRRGMAPQPLARLARDLGRALQGVELGPVESVVFRTYDDRVLVRTVDATAQCTTMLVAGGGPVDRPGLARLELDRAAARLCAQ